MNCFFCQKKKEPDFLDTQTLSQFLSERGKIVGRAKTGICAKHQRRLAREIKRARFMALLPFVKKAE
jgi:small subunit ribosomal protein S18